MLSDKTISTLALPENQEEAIKRITTLQVFMMSALQTASVKQMEAMDLARQINHLQDLYMKKYSKPVKETP